MINNAPKPQSPNAQVVNSSLLNQDLQAQWIDLGQMEYRQCADLQATILDQVVQGQRPHTLLFVEHPPVLTLGANFHEENLLLTPEEYAKHGIQVEKTDRGGDVTFHGPKQLVIYPIFNVAELGKDLHKWLRDLEEVVIRVLVEYGLSGYRFPPNTGVWVDGRKIAAIGIKIRKWISMHGIALNCDNDLRPFELIVPCGIRDYGVTSLSKELKRDVTTQDAMPIVLRCMEEVFGLKLEKADVSELSSA